MNEIAPVNSTALMSFIERAAINPDFDVQKFGELLRMQREMEHDQARRAFNQAMAITQADMPPVVRGATNKHLGNSTPSLRMSTGRCARSTRRTASVFASDRRLLPRDTSASPARWRMRRLFRGELPGRADQQRRLAGRPPATTGVQAVGSAVTYLRRYLLGMVFKIVLADDDDDGEGMRSSQPPRHAPSANMGQRGARGNARRTRRDGSGTCWPSWPRRNRGPMSSQLAA